ncbi:MAG: RagB/SusD family nutrient uptake outer membrane protein [Longimicrobiales bacterium]
MRQRLHERWTTRATRVLVTGLGVAGLTACDSLLEVELPHLLTDDAIQSANTAELQVNSAIALFECGYTHFGLTTLGHDDTMTSVSGVGSGNNVYSATAASGNCDTSDTAIAWFDQIMGARAMLSTTPSRMVATSQGTVTGDFPVGRGVYDRIQDEWGIAGVINGERLSALASIYVAMSLGHLGEIMCDMSIDGSDLLTPDEVLAVAEGWITSRALGHITNAGTGFTVMPFGVTSSATATTGGTPTEMALAVRARIRWARGDLAGADADAATVLGTRSRFTAWVTRDVGPTRRNKVWFTNTFQGYSGMMGLNRNWNGPARNPNPATGTQWPTILPFTGYIGLGLTPDGRALEPHPTGGAPSIPVRFAEEARNSTFAQVPCTVASPAPGCVVGAVQDHRVQHGRKQIQTGFYEVPFRYGTTAAGSDGNDIPYMTWEELRLIRAERYNQLNDRTNAIAQINAIRSAPSITGASSSNQAAAALPAISGAYLAALTDGTNDQAEMRAAIIEERRREFFSEGRYMATKIQNTDLTWFPRLQGSGLTYQNAGGVRLLLPADEYTNNPYMIARGRESARGTGCTTAAPGLLPGATVPLF